MRLVSGSWLAGLLLAHVAFLSLRLALSRGVARFFDGMSLLYH